MNECTYCGAKTDNPKYCSRSCSVSERNKGKRKHGKYIRRQPCLVCGTVVTKDRNLYCSRECKLVGMQRDKIQSWISGRWEPSSEYGLPPIIREFLIMESGQRCSQCGWQKRNVVTGKVPLQIDHINGHAKDNSRDNLKVLCPNCHSLTKTFGSLNKGFGRSYRYPKEGG